MPQPRKITKHTHEFHEDIKKTRNERNRKEVTFIVGDFNTEVRRGQTDIFVEKTDCC